MCIQIWIFPKAISNPILITPSRIRHLIKQYLTTVNVLTTLRICHKVKKCLQKFSVDLSDFILTLALVSIHPANAILKSQ